MNLRRLYNYLLSTTAKLADETIRVTGTFQFSGFHNLISIMRNQCKDYSLS